MSIRRLWVLVSGLPRDSVLIREVVGEAAEWSVDTYRLADIVDQLQNLTYITVKAYGGKMRKPRPVPRPRQSQPTDRR